MELFQKNTQAWRAFRRFALQGSAWLRSLNRAEQNFVLGAALYATPEEAVKRLGIEAGRPARLVRTAHRRCSATWAALGAAFVEATTPQT